MTDLLADLTAALSQATPEQIAQIDKLIAPELAQPWLPVPGPQTEAYTSEADVLLYGGSAGGGKALALDTPVPTPNGWSRMGDLKPGDVVFDADGKPCNVVAVSPVMIGRRCYDVRFSDGAVITADADHLWVTQTATERGRELKASDEWRAARSAKRALRGSGKRPDLALRNKAWAATKGLPTRSVRTTEAIAATVLNGRRLEHSVDVAGPLVLPSRTLPIDPYLFGAWLGDGTSAGARITIAEPEMVALTTEAAALHGWNVTKGSGPYDYGVVGGLKVALQGLGVIRAKAIPQEYLRASFDERLALLRGLMDTDGYADPRGQCEFTTTSPVLAAGVAELVRSLGCKTTIRVGDATLNGRVISDKYRIKFVAEFEAFRLRRKADRQMAAKHRLTTKRRYIEAVEPRTSVPVRCIQVDSPTRTYLCGREMVPTHNSDLLIGTALTRHTKSVIYRRSYVDIISEGGLGPRLVTLLGSRDGYRESPAPMWTDGKRSIEFGALEKPGAEMSAQGRAKDFIGFDEGAQLSEAKVRFVMGWLRTTDPKQRCRVIIATNPPTGAEGQWLLKWFAPWLEPGFANPAKPGELRWCVFIGDRLQWCDGPEPIEIDGETYTPRSHTFIPSRLQDNPYLRDTGYRERLQSMPEPLRSQLLKGDFLAGREDDPYQIIPSAWVDEAMARWGKGRGGAPQTVIGVDVAQGGADNTTLAPLYGDWFDNLVLVPGKGTPDGRAVAGLVTQHRRGNSLVVMDCTGGWGGSAREHLQQQGVKVAAFVASAKSTARTKPRGELGFVNQRAEAWWTLREGLDPANMPEIALPPDPALKVELTAPTWRLRRDEILVESKDEIRERIGRSTDRADAIVQAWLRRREGARQIIAPIAKQTMAIGVGEANGW